MKLVFNMTPYQSRLPVAAMILMTIYNICLVMNDTHDHRNLRGATVITVAIMSHQVSIKR